MPNFDCKDGSKQVTDAAKDGIESNSSDDAKGADGSRERDYYDIYNDAQDRSREAFIINNFDVAIEILNKAINELGEEPDNKSMIGDLYADCADIYRHIGDRDSEMAVITKVIELRGFDWDYQKRARLYEKTGDYDKALADYTTALYREKSPESYLWRGAVFFKKKDYDSAISDFLNSVKCCSWCGDMPTDLHGPARRFFRKNNGKRCGECLESFYMCGLSYHRKGDLKSAIKYLNKALWRDSDFEKAKNLRKYLLAEEKRSANK